MMRRITRTTAALIVATAAADATPPSSLGGNAYTYSFRSDVNYELSAGVVPGEFCDPHSPLSLSGYLNVDGSRFDVQRNKRYFYWFFERRSTSLLPEDERPAKPDDDKVPFVVWLNGGPGCSSMMGLLQENSPCLVNKDGRSTRINPYSWTEAAHVLYLDQPAGTGYSYGDASDDNEEMVAEDAYYFLQSFFQSPEGSKYKDLPLYLTGESFAGHFIPAIAHRIKTGNQNHVKEGLLHLPLAGLAIGNGAIDIEEQMKYFAEMAYNNPHGIKILDEGEYEAMKAAAVACSSDARRCNKAKGDENNLEKKFLCQKAANCEEEFFKPLTNHGRNVSIYDITKPCIGPMCTDTTDITTFLNLDKTKETLGIPSGVTWEECDDHINRIWSFADRVANTAPYISESLDAELPVLIYSGDLDYICNYMGNRAVALKLEWEHGDDFRAAEEHDWNNGGGLARSANNLSFLQVYDAGHMVPQDQAKQALTMITQFLNGEAF